MGNAILSSGVNFVRHVIGIAVRPYETYRRIVKEGSFWDILYIAIIVSFYFIVSSVEKTILLISATGLTFLFAVSLFRGVGQFFGGKGTWKELAIAWGYTLIPTVTWFWMTLLLYVLIPPPRTNSAMGVTFSIVYLLVSACLLFWKIILSYLALRFSLRLDLGKILLVCAIVLPILGLYSIAVYRMGIFRIPFI